MDPLVAILTVAATVLCGLGLIGMLASSVEKRSILIPFVVVLMGIGLGVYGYTLQPETPAARLPLAFIEVVAMMTR